MIANDAQEAAVTTVRTMAEARSWSGRACNRTRSVSSLLASAGSPPALNISKEQIDSALDSIFDVLHELAPAIG